MLIVEAGVAEPTRIKFPGGEAIVHPIFGADRPRWNQVDPGAADYIIAACSIVPADASPRSSVESLRAFARSLPHFAVAPERHIITDFSDYDRPDAELLPAIVMKVSANARDAAVLPIHYPAIAPPRLRDIAEATIDISFQGSVVTSSLRKDLSREATLWKGTAVEFRATERPFWMMPAEERERYTVDYAELMHRSQFVICPRGRGLNSRRFYEALAFGRLPVLIADAVKLPLASVIPYHKFVVRVPEGYARWTPEFVGEFRREHDLREASRQAREAFDRWFAPRRFREMIEASLTNRPEEHRCHG